MLPCHVKIDEHLKLLLYLKMNKMDLKCAYQMQKSCFLMSHTAVTLEGRDKETFRGFIIVVTRLQGDIEERVGAFIEPHHPQAEYTYWYPAEEGITVQHTE